MRNAQSASVICLYCIVSALTMRARIHGRIRSFKQVRAGFGSQRRQHDMKNLLIALDFPRPQMAVGARGRGRGSRVHCSGEFPRSQFNLSFLVSLSSLSLSDRMSFTSKEKSALEIEGIEEGSMGTDISPSAAQ